MEFDDLIESLIAIRNQDVDDYNQSLDKIKNLSTELKHAESLATSLRKTNISQADKLVTLEAQAKETSNALEQMSQRNTSLNQRLQTQATEHKQAMSSMSADVRAATVRIREASAHKANAAKHKQSNDELRKRNSRLTADIAKYRKELHEAKSQLATAVAREAEFMAGRYVAIWLSDEESLLINPSRMVLGGSSFGPQITLFYTNNRGVYLTMFLDDDHKAYLPYSVEIPEDTNPRTEKLVKKYSVSASPKAIEIAQEWLYRVNVTQKGQIYPEDTYQRNEISDEYRRRNKTAAQRSQKKRR